jgi:uncharacterized lipoprotein YmbA
LFALVMLAGCASSARTAVPARATLVVRAPVADAVLWIDEAHIGALSDVPAGVRLRAGTHRIELRHDHFHTRYAEVTLIAGEKKVLELTLAEALP